MLESTESILWKIRGSQFLRGITQQYVFPANENLCYSIMRKYGRFHPARCEEKM